MRSLLHLCVQKPILVLYLTIDANCSLYTENPVPPLTRIDRSREMLRNERDTKPAIPQPRGWHIRVTGAGGLVWAYRQQQLRSPLHRQATQRPTKKAQ